MMIMIDLSSIRAVVLVASLFVAHGLQGEEGRTGGKERFTNTDTSWYDTDTPMPHDDPLFSVIGELTSASQPDASAVVRAVYGAAGEPVPSADAFKVSDLGEGVGNKDPSGTLDGLRWLLAGASSENALNRWSSLDSLDTVLGKDSDGSATTGSSSHAGNAAKTEELAHPSSEKAQTRLDSSAEFVPTVLLDISGGGSTLNAPSDAAIHRTLKHLRAEQRHLKRKVDDDMEVADITSNDRDLSQGLKEVEKLKQVDERLSEAKREARRLEQVKQGREPAYDLLTQQDDLEHKVEKRVWSEHLRRLKLHEDGTKKEAFKASMRAAEMREQLDEGKKGVTRGEIEKADAVASVLVDKSKAAGQALEAALGEDKEQQAMDPKVSKPVIMTLPGAQATGGAMSKDTAEKLATSQAKKAEHALEGALLTDSSFDKAAKAAQVALAYEKTADGMSTDKLKEARTAAKNAKAAADQAMVNAIQTGTEESYMKLREAMGARQDTKDAVHDILTRQKMEAKLSKVKGDEENPTVMLAQRMSEDSDATFYKDVQRAERGYEHAEETARDGDVDAVGTLVGKEEKADLQSKQNKMALVKLRTTTAATKVASAQKDAEGAIREEHEGAEDYRISRRHAWNAITAKEAAKVASEKTHERLQSQEERLADEQASAEETKERYERLKTEAEEARRTYIGAHALYESGREKLKRREETLSNVRKIASKNVAAELHRLALEVDILEKTGHSNMAKKEMQKHTVEDDANFVRREEQRELDDRIKLVKEESSKSLAEEMNKLVVDEKNKLQEEISGSPDGDVKPHFEASSKRLDDALAALSAKTDKSVREKISAMSNDDSANATSTPQSKDQEGQDDGTLSVLDSMFKTLEKIQAGNNKVEMQQRDKKYIRTQIQPVVKRLKQMQTNADQPLAVAEEELRKIIAAETNVHASLKNNTYEGAAAAEGKTAVDDKMTDAKRAMKLAKAAAAGASSTEALKRANAKAAAAKKMMDAAKLHELQLERQKVEVKLVEANQAQQNKRSALKQAEDAAAQVLHSLRQKDLQKAKTKILRAQIREDRFELKNMAEKMQESRDESEHAKHSYNDIGDRAERAQFAYRKASRIARGEEGHTKRFKEAADDDERRYKVAVKVAHLADEQYKGGKQEAKILKREADKNEKALRDARKDLKIKEKAEQEMILSSQNPSRR